MTDRVESDPDGQDGQDGQDVGALTETPRYEKPVIRRYDQIDQVRPYGPSEV